jgi:hypothetical protein
MVDTIARLVAQIAWLQLLTTQCLRNYNTWSFEARKVKAFKMYGRN